jgi:uncharacterized membrane protein
MKDLVEHIRDSIFRGLLAIIPLLLCAIAINLLYVLIDKKIIVFLSQFIEVRQIPGLGILLLLIALYLIGLTVSNILGRQFLRFLESASKKIPIINSIYSVGKQLTQGLSADPKNKAFKKAILVKLNDNDVWTPGFVMGNITDSKTNEELMYVYLPTVPTPTGGFIFIVSASETRDPGWTVEECLKVIVSMGIISPKKI